MNNLRKKRLENSNDSVKYIALDILDYEGIPNKIDEAKKLFPEQKIEILVNSAGVGGNSSLADISEKEYDLIMNTNVKGTFFVCQSIAKHMITNGIKGHILNISSSSALRPHGHRMKFPNGQ